MLTYFTTTTAPPWDETATDQLGNIIPVTGGTFAVEFVNISNNQKSAGTGTFLIVDGPNGHFRYQLSNTDLANAYATTGSLPGSAMFDVCYQVMTSSGVYDLNPTRIMIRKI